MPRTKQFEKVYKRRRDQIERGGIRLFRNAIADQYDAYLKSVSLLDPVQWEAQVSLIPDEPIERALKTYYKRFAPLALMQRKNILGQKNEEDDFWINEFERFLLNFVTNEAGEKITQIAGTTRKRTLSLVRGVLEDGTERGLGIPEIKRNLIKAVGDDLKGNTRARARAIAQTEIIGGSNRAAVYAAESTGLNYRKFWSTSGLPNIRATHIAAESYSQQVGGLRRDQLFPNGLMFPGDPNGSADEIINCRCTLLIVVQ